MKKPSTATQRLASGKNPMDEMDAYWIYAYRLTGKYPKPNKNCGKWLVFKSVAEIDSVWEKIKLATEVGLLGSASKVATARPSFNAANTKVKVICVYTYDYTDKDDVMRIRQELRELGVENKIAYKTDKATLQGQYKVNGNSQISAYYM